MVVSGAQGRGAPASRPASRPARAGRHAVRCQRLQRAVRGRAADLHRRAVAAPLPRGRVLARPPAVLRAVPEPAAAAGAGRRAAQRLVSRQPRGHPACSRSSASCRCAASSPGTCISHVVLQAKLHRAAIAQAAGEDREGPRAPAVEDRVPRPARPSSAAGSRGSSRRTRGPTVWGDYADEPRLRARRRSGRSGASSPSSSSAPGRALLFDLGCNTGDYAALALEAGAGSVVGFDCRPAGAGGARSPAPRPAASPSCRSTWTRPTRARTRAGSRRSARASAAARRPTRSWRSPSSTIWRSAATCRWTRPSPG